MLQGRENVEERALFGYTEKVNRQSSTLNLIQMMSWELSDTMNKIAQNLEYCKDLTAFCALSETPGALTCPAPESLSKAWSFARYPSGIRARRGIS